MRGIHAVEYLEDYEGGLGTRMKMYENSVGTTLDRNFPVIIRVDGRSFKTYTKEFIKPFDTVIRDAMMHTARLMAKEIQGVKLVYSQSDEITLLLTAYENPLSTLWFDGRVQKIVSNAASVATEAFNEYMDKEYWLKYPERTRKRARFDARTFNLPFIEVNNYWYWRQCESFRSKTPTFLYGKQDNNWVMLSNTVLFNIDVGYINKYLNVQQYDTYTNNTII